MESNIQKEMPKPTTPAHNSGDLDKAIERIYEQYGTDLSAFFRDAYREAAKCQAPVRHADD